MVLTHKHTEETHTLLNPVLSHLKVIIIKLCCQNTLRMERILCITSKAFCADVPRVTKTLSNKCASVQSFQRVSFNTSTKAITERQIKERKVTKNSLWVLSSPCLTIPHHLILSTLTSPCQSSSCQKLIPICSEFVSNDL